MTALGWIEAAVLVVIVILLWRVVAELQGLRSELAVLIGAKVNPPEQTLRHSQPKDHRPKVTGRLQ